MRNIFTYLFCLIASVQVSGQDLRTSMHQYSLSALPINPAYTSYEEATGFEATYLGNFISQGNVSRSVFLNMQGATERGGLGLTFQLHRDAFLGEINLRPAWSRRFSLANDGEVSYGFVVGLNYFDVANNFFSNNTDFVSVDAGLGIYYRLDRFFAGLSVLNLFEKTAGLDDPVAGGQPRENPYNLHIGGVFRLTDDLDLRPAALFRYTNLYALPDQSFNNIGHTVAMDLQASVFIQNTYIASAIYGITDLPTGSPVSRYGLSVTYILDKFRLTYAIQNNVQSGVSLPVTHLVSAGYDILGKKTDGIERFF